MDDEEQVTLPAPDRAQKRGKKGSGRAEKPKLDLPDPEGAHKKFMAIMIGLFLLVLILMLVFQEYLDFSIDGGI